MFFNQHKTRVGDILKDKKCDVMAISKVESEVVDLETIELLTLLRGLQFCMHTDTRNILESYYLVTVKELQTAAAISFSRLGNLLKKNSSLVKLFGM